MSEEEIKRYEGKIEMHREYIEEDEQIIDFLEARAFIIEEINKYNKGDNGFKHGEANGFIYYDHEEQDLCSDDIEDYQYYEGGFYFRGQTLASQALSCDKLRAAYLTFFGVI